MNFNTIGIICEYNPFHFGHKYHIQKSRDITSCNNVVCIMSGSMVQRGECAIFDKWHRAKSAIESGADLVIELPAYYVLQSADIFAEGAIKILDGLGVVDAISFGSESNDINKLSTIAKIMAESNEYNKLLNDEMKKGISYPKASQKAIEKISFDLSDIMNKPNNTLGISYIKALNAIKSTITPLCIKRNNDYHGSQSNDEYMSASEIRRMIAFGEDYSKYASNYNNINTYSLKNAETYIIGTLRNMSDEYLSKIKGSEDGMGNLIIKSASKACTLDELYELCISKRYTLHRIQRFIIAALLNINYNAEPSYIRVLGMNKKGAELLSKIKEVCNLDIITKTADYKKNNRMFETDIKSTDLAMLCSSDITKRTVGKDFTTSPVIEI